MGYFLLATFSWLRSGSCAAIRGGIYLLLSPAGDSAPSMHLSSWLATIWRSSSSSRVSLSNWSSCEETLMAAFTRLGPARRRRLSPGITSI